MAAPLQREELVGEEELVVYRLVHTDELEPGKLAPSMRSRKALGKAAIGRETIRPETWEGVSVFKTLEGARGLGRQSPVDTTDR